MISILNAGMVCPQQRFDYAHLIMGKCLLVCWFILTKDVINEKYVSG